MASAALISTQLHAIRSGCRSGGRYDLKDMKLGIDAPQAKEAKASVVVTRAPIGWGELSGEVESIAKVELLRVYYPLAQLTQSALMSADRVTPAEPQFFGRVASELFSQHLVFRCHCLPVDMVG